MLKRLTDIKWQKQIVQSKAESEQIAVWKLLYCSTKHADTVFLIKETWFNPGVLDGFFSRFSEFSVFRCDRDRVDDEEYRGRLGGGVVILVPKKFISSVQSVSKSGFFESIWCTIALNNTFSHKIVVMCKYRIVKKYRNRNRNRIAKKYRIIPIPKPKPKPMHITIK